MASSTPMEVDSPLVAVERSIQNVEEQIKAVEDRLEEVQDPDEKKYLRKEKKQLRKEEEQLWKEEEQLRENEEQLREKEILLFKSTGKLLSAPFPKAPMEVDSPLVAVERSIQNVEEQIKAVEDRLGKEQDPDEKKYLRKEKKQLRKEKEQLLEKEILLFKSSGPAAGAIGDVKWMEVLQLSSRQKEFLDGYLGNKYGLQQVDTGVAKVPKYMNLPSMLLFGLGRRRFTHAQDVKKAISDGQAKGQQVVVVAGTSGCGKTRSLYDMFSEEDGFYFVMSTALNGGSNDMSLMVARLQLKMLRDDKTGGNEAVARVFALLLLACRTVIYQYCKTRGVDSRGWLLLQVACRGMLGHYDVFADFFEKALAALPEDRPGIMSQVQSIHKVIINLSRSMKIPTVAIDEGQMALKQLSRSYFWSTSRGWLPLANPLVQSLKVDTGFAHTIVVTGTGHTLHFKQEQLLNSVKMATAPQSFGNFSGWEDPQQMVEFASMVVKLSKEDLSLLQSKTWGLFPKLRGRFRPFCDVIQIMLAKSMTLGEAAEYLIVAQTTKEGKPEFPKSFYSRVASLSSMGMDGSGTVLITELEKAVVFYFGCGRGWPVNEHSVDAIEAGIARVVTDDYGAEIEEYLILLAARNFFEDKYAEKGYDRRDYLPQQLFQLMVSSPYASAQGLSYQNFAGAHFQAMWKKYEGKMDAMPLFQPLLGHKDCPRKMREVAKLHGKLREGMISVYVNDNRYDLNMFLSDVKTDRQMCTDYILADKFGSDLVRVMAYELPGGETVLVHNTEQYKLKKDPLSRAEMVDALDKTSIRGVDLQTHLQLRILYIFPQSRASWPAAFWNGDVGTIIVDAENGPQVFGAATAHYLQSLNP